MNRRSLLATLAAAIPASAAFARPAAGAKKHGVVFQVTDADPGKWRLTLSNAVNVQAELGKDHVQIEIVAYGPGLAMLKAESEVEAQLAGALDNSMGLIACENTMITTHTPRSEMYSGIDYVKAGVPHIMKRQREGWAYIRP